MGGGLSRDIAVSSEMQKYFSMLDEEITTCYNIADEARKKGLDPETNVEIPQATDLAARVEKLVGPEGIAEEIRETTKKIGNRELVSLDISKKIIKEKKYSFKNSEEAIDQAVRTGLAILTEGVLVAPLEGIADVKLGKNNDGTEYVDLYFSGPIRSAGGTGQAMSVLIADVVRRELGIDKFKPTTGEIERLKEEIPLYKRAQHLQYTPSVDEIDKIVRNCPICINGEGTEKVEVTGYRDLPRVETNRLRGGACLVIAEGLCLKAPKLLKHVKKLKLKGWDFLDVFVNKGKKKDEEEDSEKKGIPEILPLKKYIGEVIAGRPVFSHPSRKGGFRLRYGRSRTGGLASTSINPISMFLLDEFIALGTQLKMERPGKATIGTACDEIEKPIVLLNNGDLIELESVQQIDTGKIKKIIDVGEILIPFGEFAENNSLMPDASYCYEWWIQELQNKLKIKSEKYDFVEIQKSDLETQKKINEDFETEVDLKKPTWEYAVKISEKYDVPLHPFYNLFWHDISVEELVFLSDFIKNHGEIIGDKLQLPVDKKIKDILVELCVLHKVRDNKIIVDRFSNPLLRGCGLDKENNKLVETDRKKILEKVDSEKNILDLVSNLSGYKIRAKAPFRIGARMGRPEKAAERKMRPPPHVLFPLGNSGGNQRLINKAMQKHSIEIDAGVRTCEKCGKKTYRIFCDCGSHTVIEKNNRIEKLDISLSKEVKKAQKNIKERILPDTIKGVIGTLSVHKTPEMLEKGILRAKHNVSVFKDGTIRFDMTDAPLTHFRPREIDVSVKRLKKMGYSKDIYGEPLKDDDQLCELKVQDVIISKSCAEYFFRVAKFVDDLLVKFYGLKRFYKIKKFEDLTGHLVVGLAPHTSAGALGRIIGFTEGQVCFAHPFYHAAKRRNCYDGKQRVFLYNNKKNKFISDEIGEIVEEYSKNRPLKKIDTYGTLKCDLDSSDELFAYTLDRFSGKLVKRKVTSFIKGQTDSWVKIKTTTNRELKVTLDHNIAVIKNGKIEVKKACDVKKGDKVPIATHIPYESSIHQINLVDSLRTLPDDILKDIKIRKVDGFFKKIVKEVGRDEIIKICGINDEFQKNLSKWYKSVPLDHFIKICEKSNVSFNDLPIESRLGLRRDHVNLPVYIKDMPSLFWILGMYCAEGWSRSNETAHQISFRICDKKIKRYLLSKMTDIFSITPYTNDTKIVYSSKLLYVLFNKVWNVGSKAYDKKVPDIVYTGDKFAVQQFISAFFDGDGSISLNPDRITLYSVSQSLLEGIATLLLREDIFTRFSKTKKRLPGKKLLKRYKELKKEPVKHILFHLVLTGEDKYKFSDLIQPVSAKKNRRARMMSSLKPSSAKRLIKYSGKYFPALSYSDYTFDIVKDVKHISVNNDNTYCLDVEGEKLEDKAVFWHNQLVQIRCDGDEDGLMLLMDALLNFSHAYIPDKRGGRMDLPLIVTTRLDPSEVDKEAHNVDTLCRYPLEFYKSTLRHAHPKDVEKMMNMVSSRLGSPSQYENFGFTHDTLDISEAPKISRYKSLGSMMEKMEAQLSLAALIRAVDTPDVAYKVIERHFLPDIIGNFRAFSKQSVRCAKCNINYRRIPLNGVCTKCGSNLTLTVHEKSVRKYLDISKEVAERYHIPAYANQRIRLVEKSIDSLFMSDKVKTTKLDDFF